MFWYFPWLFFLFYVMLLKGNKWTRTAGYITCTWLWLIPLEMVSSLIVSQCLWVPTVLCFLCSVASVNLSFSNHTFNSHPRMLFLAHLMLCFLSDLIIWLVTPAFTHIHTVKADIFKPYITINGNAFCAIHTNVNWFKLLLELYLVALNLEVPKHKHTLAWFQ